jgi:hypothetical protein
MAAISSPSPLAEEGAAYGADQIQVRGGIKESVVCARRCALKTGARTPKSRRAQALPRRASAGTGTGGQA